MEREEIKEVSIDSSGRLFVYPTKTRFLHIWREAMEVHWDDSAKALYSPAPREWSYSKWFQQIVAAAQEQNHALTLSANTVWHNVSAEVKEEIQAAASSSAA